MCVFPQPHGCELTRNISNRTFFASQSFFATRSVFVRWLNVERRYLQLWRIGVRPPRLCNTGEVIFLLLCKPLMAGKIPFGDVVTILMYFQSYSYKNFLLKIPFSKNNRYYYLRMSFVPLPCTCLARSAFVCLNKT